MKITERADGSRAESLELRDLLKKYKCLSVQELREKMKTNAELRSAMDGIAQRAEASLRAEAKG